MLSRRRITDLEDQKTKSVQIHHDHVDDAIDMTSADRERQLLGSYVQSYQPSLGQPPDLHVLLPSQTINRIHVYDPFNNMTLDRGRRAHRSHGQPQLLLNRLCNVYSRVKPLARFLMCTGGSVVGN